MMREPHDGGVHRTAEAVQVEDQHVSVRWCHVAFARMMVLAAVVKRYHARSNDSRVTGSSPAGCARVRMRAS